MMISYFVLPSIDGFKQGLPTLWLAGVLSAGLLFVGCDKANPKAALNSEQIAKLLPSHVKDKQAWAVDLAGVFDELKIDKSTQNLCTAIAVIDQESNFHADPAVPNLGTSSLAALTDKLDDKLGKVLAKQFKQMLANHPNPNNSFIKQIKAVKTEKQLDELYREMFDYFGKNYKVGIINDTAKQFNLGIDEKLNPITTLGSMQVHIDYAKAHRRKSMNDSQLRDDLYSRYGGLYYGIHRLMLYQADYERPLYRFADYNSGMYSSRNASFQQAVSQLSQTKLALDGDLLLYDGTSVKRVMSNTEKAVVSLLPSLPDLTDKQIRRDLRHEKKQSFETTATYQAIATAYQQKTGKPMAYAIMPQVVISSAKMSRDYNTNWFATNVNKRYERCMASADKQGLGRI